jgi:hypothetical protein
MLPLTGVSAAASGDTAIKVPDRVTSAHSDTTTDDLFTIFSLVAPQAVDSKTIY